MSAPAIVFVRLSLKVAGPAKRYSCHRVRDRLQSLEKQAEKSAVRTCVHAGCAGVTIN
jgi:hypothetical protein